MREMNDLYDLLADSRKGYHDAAKRCQEQDVSGFLERLSEQRDAMEGELGKEIRRFKPDDHTQEGTVKGIFHRAWMDIRDALSGSDGRSVLDDCERGERYLIQRYDTVIADPGVASESKVVLRGQRIKFEENLNQLEALRSTSSATTK